MNRKWYAEAEPSTEYLQKADNEQANELEKLFSLVKSKLLNIYLLNELETMLN